MALPNNTFASPGNPYYAVKGEIVGAQDWYQYPSLTGEIELIDASGTQLLQSIEGNLYYNNELLAKANDIQDIADWSLYPALASVDMNGQSLLDVSSVVINNDLTVQDISANGIINAQSLFVTAGIETANSGIFTNFISTNGGAGVSGNVKTSTVSASGNVAAGSLTTTGGLDMTNSSITRASSVNISNSGFAPYGALTSPDGVQLTWNGAAITTGAGGNVAQWANFPAVATVNANSNDITNAGTVNAGNVIIGGGATGLLQTSRITTLSGVGAPPLLVTAYPGLTTTADGGNIVTTAGAVSGTGNISTTAKGVITDTAYGEVHTITNNFEVTCNGGLNPITTPNINLTAENGNGGQINITANPGSIAALGGAINITANGGTVYIPQPPPDPPLAVTVGGEINIKANTGSGGLYTLTSAVNIAAAGVNSYAGAIPPVGSLAGYNFIYGTTGVSICAGLPSSGFQLPFTTYIYGVGTPGFTGVRLQSPYGIGMLSPVYATDLYPFDGTDLTIQGRSAPSANVVIKDCASLTMTSSGNVITDFLNSLSGLGIFYRDNLRASTSSQGLYTNFIKPLEATAPGVPNLTISGNAFGGNNNYVNLANVGTLAFDATASGALTGVQSINGASWPPATGDASLWSQYPATSIIDVSGYGLTRVGDLSGVTSINGQAYPSSSTDWSLYPALQSVDISGFSLNNVDNITMSDNAVITSAGQLSIIADVSGSLILSTNGGGDVSLSTGNQGDIYISTGGAGNNIIMEGDTIGMTAAVDVQVNATLNMLSNTITNVGQINGAGGTDELRIQNTGTGRTSIIDLSGGVSVASQFGVVGIIGGSRLDLLTNTGNITINPIGSGLGTGTIQMLGNTNIGVSGAPETLTVTGPTNVTGDVVSSFGVDNNSLNTIGALVGGIPSGFRDATEFYVSFDGSDTTGLGSILSPYQTIQKAITQAELVSSSLQVCVINVASGHYTENLTFNRGYICLNGSLQSQTGNEVCEITGSINIAVTGTSDLFNRQITFTGFNLTCGAGQAITNTSTTPHIVGFQDCKCFVVNQFYVSTGAFSDGRLYLTNVEIQQTLAGSTLPVIVTNLGQVELERVDISLSGNCSAIVIGGTSILSRFSLSALETTNTGATLAPMLSFTSSTTSTHTMGNVAFAISAATTKTNTDAVYIASGVNTTLLMLNNVFSLQGTSSSTNFTVGYDGSGSPAILGINNTSLNVNVLLPQTTAVQSGITQISYTDINPPGLACYSSTADQAITVAGTPQALTFNTTQFNQGTTLLLNSRVYANAQGNYNLNHSVEIQHAGGGSSQIVTTFLKKNGTTIVNTGRQWTVGSGSSQFAAMAEHTVSLNAGDYVEVFFSGDTSISANATAAAGALPAIPSVVFNIKQFR